MRIHREYASERGHMGRVGWAAGLLFILFLFALPFVFTLDRRTDGHAVSDFSARDTVSAAASPTSQDHTAKGW
jgi:hypothetical protein